MLPPEHLRIALTLHMDTGRDTAQIGIHVSEYVAEITLGIYTAAIPIGHEGQEMIEEVQALLEAALSEHWFPF
jgi:hypothetical protein